MTYTQKVVIGDATLLLGDCMDILPTLGKVDAVITDPPYDAITHDKHLSTAADRQELGFAALTADQFQKLNDSLVSKAERWVLMTCATSHALALQGRPDFVRLGIWIKPNGAPQFTGDRPGTGWEAVAILHRQGKKRWNGGGHHAVWSCPIVSGNHPTEKPVALVSRWVEQFTDASEIILDPFMGSGTTGVAALQMNRAFIGIERDPAHFATAVKRIEQAHAQGQLFAPAQPKQEQQTIDMEAA